MTTRGRPRAFDADAALDRAMEVFWRRGFEGASMAELTDAMGISRPSLYAAYGDKAALFRRVLERYAAGPAAFAAEALGRPTGREAVTALLEGAAVALTRPDCPPGCLAVQGALACGEAGIDAKADLARVRAGAEAALLARLEQADRAGELPPETAPAELARFFAATFQGMAVQASSGASTVELRAVAALALRVWPAPGAA